MITLLNTLLKVFSKWKL